MRSTLVLIAIATFGPHANGQLISPSGGPIPIPVEIASDVPPKLQGNASPTFDELDICFDGGSHGAEFVRGDGGKLMLFFPHFGYWTAAARKARTQPVAVLVQRKGEAIMVEIKAGSALNQRLVDLIDADTESGNHSPEKLDTLKRIRDCVRKRTPLREIAERMDPETGTKVTAEGVSRLRKELPGCQIDFDG